MIDSTTKSATSQICKSFSGNAKTSFFERTMIGNSKLSPAVRESNNDFSNAFKDSYVFEFLNLPDPHSESDLQRGLVRQMKNFILEIGKDFLFIVEEYKLQVGNSNF